MGMIFIKEVWVLENYIFVFFMYVAICYTRLALQEWDIF